MLSEQLDESTEDVMKGIQAPAIYACGDVYSSRSVTRCCWRRGVRNYSSGYPLLIGIPK